MKLIREPVPQNEAHQGFRSRLEASWADTLTWLAIEWRYEPTRFVLPSGTRYLPDFYLPEIGTWLEVKGEGIPGREKAHELAEAVVCRCGGACSCEWPGGEIVLLGFASLPTPGKRFGTMHWNDAVGGNALLGECRRCHHRSWVRPRHSMACRFCKANDPGVPHFDHLLNSGNVDFRAAGRAERFDI
jgi:hypothetical protein